jgi:hypothetical protein
MGLGAPALIAPQTGEACRSAKLPRFCSLVSCNRKRTLKTNFRFTDVPFTPRNLASLSMNLGFPQPFFRRVHGSNGFVDVESRCGKLTKPPMRHRQMGQKRLGRIPLIPLIGTQPFRRRSC